MVCAVLILLVFAVVLLLFCWNEMRSKIFVLFSRQSNNDKISINMRIRFRSHALFSDCYDRMSKLEGISRYVHALKPVVEQHL